MSLSYLICRDASMVLDSYDQEWALHGLDGQQASAHPSSFKDVFHDDASRSMDGVMHSFMPMYQSGGHNADYGSGDKDGVAQLLRMMGSVQGWELGNRAMVVASLTKASMG